VEPQQLIGMTGASMLRMELGFMEVLNHSWLRNLREQLPFSDSEMQSISRIGKGDIPSFRKRSGLTISCAQDHVQKSEMIHGKRR
jgi:hypothetical protein